MAGIDYLNCIPDLAIVGTIAPTNSVPLYCVAGALVVMRHTEFGAGLIIDMLDRFGCEVPNDRFTRLVIPGVAYHFPALPAPEGRKQRMTERIKAMATGDQEEAPVPPAPDAVQGETLDSPARATSPTAPATEGVHAALKRIPFPVTLKMMGQVPERHTAVPFGVTTDSTLWLDLETDLLHLGVYGTSSGGKDNLFRLMFYALTKRNTPEVVQFFFLDGKNDWLLPNLRGLAHMWRDAAGGSGKAGADAIKSGITAVQVEMERRFDLVNGANCRTREQYMRKTGENIPLLVVVLSDVMNVVADEAETLLIDLVSKARAVGIRVVVSMQTPTGASMKWRSNLSTNASFVQTDETQDGPALGLREKAGLRYRPSELPGPKQRPGVMVVRHGNDQYLVQVPLVDDDMFDGWVEGLPRRSAPHSSPEKPGLEPDSGVRSGAVTSGVRSKNAECEPFNLLESLIERYDVDRDAAIRSLLKAGMTYERVAENIRAAGMNVGTSTIARISKELKSEEAS
jgi:hypothetical protein